MGLSFNSDWSERPTSRAERFSEDVGEHGIVAAVTGRPRRDRAAEKIRNAGGGSTPRLAGPPDLLSWKEKRKVDKLLRKGKK